MGGQPWAPVPWSVSIGLSVPRGRPASEQPGCEATAEQHSSGLPLCAMPRAPAAVPSAARMGTLVVSTGRGGESSWCVSAGRYPHGRAVPAGRQKEDKSQSRDGDLCLRWAQGSRKGTFYVSVSLLFVFHEHRGAAAAESRRGEVSLGWLPGCRGRVLEGEGPGVGGTWEPSPKRAVASSGGAGG